MSDFIELLRTIDNNETQGNIFRKKTKMHRKFSRKMDQIILKDSYQLLLHSEQIQKLRTDHSTMISPSWETESNLFDRLKQNLVSGECPC